MATHNTAFHTILAELTTALQRDVSSAMIVHMDGTIVATHHDNLTSDERAAVLAATMLTMIRQAANESGMGAIEEIVVRARGGQFMLMPIREQLFLVMELESQVNLSRVHLEGRFVTAAIGRLLVQPDGWAARRASAPQYALA